MKIIILSDDFPPPVSGGAEQSTLDLARAFKKRGNQVFVITTCREKSDARTIDYEGLKVFKIYANYHERWRAYLSLYNPQTVGKVRKLIREINPDIIHVQNIHYYLSFHCLKLAKKSGKNVFWTARDAMPFSYGKLATKKYLERFDYKTNFFDHLKQAKKRYNPLRNFLIRRYLKYPDKLFAVSHALKRALEVNGIKNVEVSHTGIDVDDWQITTDKIEEFKKKHGLVGKSVVFFGGRISDLKGLKQIEQAIVKVKKEIPQAVLLMAGTEGLGWLAGDELKSAYHCANIVVVPSVCFDAFPRSNLEAMACQKAVIATCYGGSPEIVQDGVTGYIVNPFDIDLLANRILDLLKNPQKAREFGEAGYRRVIEKFNLVEQAGKYLEYFSNALNSSTTF